MQTFYVGQIPPVTFGAGRICKLPELANRLANGPVFVIADAVLADFGVTDQLKIQMTEHGLTEVPLVS